MARTPSVNALLAQAQTFLGDPYHWGGSSPQTGFDCSGFVQWLYGQQGITIPRVTYDQVNAGTEVAKGDLRAGDIVFFEPSQQGPGHEGLYIGNGKFIESPHTGANIRISSLAGRGDYVTARRIIPDGAPSLRTVAAKPAKAAAPTANGAATAEQPPTTAPQTAAPQIVPPASAPVPLPGGGMPSYGPSLPGSQVYTLDPHQVASSWQALSQKYPASQPVQQQAYLSGLGVGK